MNNQLHISKLPDPPAGKSSWPWSVSVEPLPETMPDGSPWPKISVVTPSFNQGQFIEETIRSVLLQGYPNLEFIIIDGGSTDNTLEIIKKYEPWLAYWISEPDRGQGHAVNKGIFKSHGDFLLWLNSDDIILPSALRIIAKVALSVPGVKMITGQALVIDEEGNTTGTLTSYFNSWDEMVTNPRNSVRQISTFFFRNLFDEFGLVNESLYISMDTELMVRFCQRHKPLIIQDFLTAFRVYHTSKTGKKLVTGYIENDQTRGKYLSTPYQRINYRRRSSLNWLSLFENLKYSRTERMTYAMRSIKMYPRVIYSRRFWSAIKKNLVEKGKTK